MSTLKASPSLARSTLCQRLARPESRGNCLKKVAFVRRISGDPARYFSRSFSRRRPRFFILYRLPSFARSIARRRHLVTFFTTPIDWWEGGRTMRLQQRERERNGPLRSPTLSSARTSHRASFVSHPEHVTASRSPKSKVRFRGA